MNVGEQLKLHCKELSSLKTLHSIKLLRAPTIRITYKKNRSFQLKEPRLLNSKQQKPLNLTKFSKIQSILQIFLKVYQNFKRKNKRIKKFK